MAKVCSEFGNIGEVSLLAGRLRRRDAGHGGDERLSISQQLKLSTFKEEPKMPNRGEGR